MPQKVKISKGFLNKYPSFPNGSNKETCLRDLVCNSYDADADWVKITFANFDKNYRAKEESKIIIEDNGNGISKDILNYFFVYKRTAKVRKAITAGGRVLRGGAGAGRFAILLLGKVVEIRTKTKEGQGKHIMKYKFMKPDNIEFSLIEKKPKANKNMHGTTITISSVNGVSFNKFTIYKFYEKLIRLRRHCSSKTAKDFEIWIYKDDKCERYFLYDYKPRWKIWLLYVTGHIIVESQKLMSVFGFYK